MELVISSGRPIFRQACQQLSVELLLRRRRGPIGRNPWVGWTAASVEARDEWVMVFRWRRADRQALDIRPRMDPRQAHTG